MRKMHVFNGNFPEKHMEVLLFRARVGHLGEGLVIIGPWALNPMNPSSVHLLGEQDSTISKKAALWACLQGPGWKDTRNWGSWAVTVGQGSPVQRAPCGFSVGIRQCLTSEDCIHFSAQRRNQGRALLTSMLSEDFPATRACSQERTWCLRFH